MPDNTGICKSLEQAGFGIVDFSPKSIFIFLIPDLTAWSPCFQCGVCFPWRWSMTSSRAKCSQQQSMQRAPKTFCGLPQKCRDSWEVLSSFFLEHRIPLLSTSGWVSKGWELHLALPLGLFSSQIDSHLVKSLWSPGSLYQLCLGGINRATGAFKSYTITHYLLGSCFYIRLLLLGFA